MKAEASSDAEQEEKSRLYDSMSAQVGSILIVANSNADKIIKDANTEAEKIRADAHKEAEEIKARAEEKMNAMIACLDDRLRTVSQNYLSDYAKLISESQSRFSELTDHIRAKTETLLKTADSMGRDIEKQIAEDYLKAGVLPREAF